MKDTLDDLLDEYGPVAFESATKDALERYRRGYLREFEEKWQEIVFLTEGEAYSEFEEMFGDEDKSDEDLFTLSLPLQVLPEHEKTLATLKQVILLAGECRDLAKKCGLSFGDNSSDTMSVHDVYFMADYFSWRDNYGTETWASSSC
jgi:hypothetical protein